MRKLSFNQALEQILREDHRYREDAYYFVRAGLDFTVKQLEKPLEGEGRHLTGQELLEGLRQHALKEYGAMAQTVLNHWGVKRCEDFGEIVFNLVEKGILGKTEKDSRDDFKGGYGFEQAFRIPFRHRPKTRQPADK